MDFLKGQFDKLLLTALVLGFAAMAFHGFRYNEKELAAFAIDNSKLFSGALLTLITGRLLQRAADKNGGSTDVPKTDAPAAPTGPAPWASRVPAP